MNIKLDYGPVLVTSTFYFYQFNNLFFEPLIACGLTMLNMLSGL